MRQLIVAGGGGAEESRPLDEMLVRLIPVGHPLLYLPIALDPQARAYEKCLDWLRSVFVPLGLDQIVMWTDVTGKSDAELEPYAAAYIGGGNTFKLLYTLKRTGFAASLGRFIERGGIVYGGSAGAAILGRDIMTTAHMDANDIGLHDTTGLDLLGGYAVWCHYRPSDDAGIATYVAQSTFPVIALSERAGVWAHDGQVMALGYEPTLVFRAHTRHTYAPSSLLPF
jgi:dipeptidase E